MRSLNRTFYGIERLQQHDVNEFVPVLIVPFMELKDHLRLDKKCLHPRLNRTFYGIEN